MAIKITRRRERITTERHLISFSWNHMPGAGFSFECDVNGRLVNQDPVTMASYSQCLKDVRHEKMTGPFRCSEKGSYVQPALAECSCGAELQLADALDNGCDNCGRYYNIVGQEVVPPNSDLGRALRAEDDRFADVDDEEYRGTGPDRYPTPGGAY